MKLAAFDLTTASAGIDVQIVRVLSAVKLTDDVLKALFGEEGLLTAEQATDRLTRKWMRSLSLALGLASVGNWGFSSMDLNAAQAAYSDPQTGLSEATSSPLKKRAEVLRLSAWIGCALTGCALDLLAR